jgi:phage shock protein C
VTQALLYDGRVTDQPLEPAEPATPEEPRAEDAPPSSEPEQGPEPAPASAEAPPEHRLYRSRRDSVIAGVCGGLGEYLGVDPVLVRIAAIILVFAGGAGLLLYAIGWIAIPEEPERAAGEPAPPAAAHGPTSGAVVLGFVFVVLGAFFLLDELWPDFLSWHYVWPIALIAVGVAILLRGKR